MRRAEAVRHVPAAAGRPRRRVLEAGPLEDIANWVERYRKFWDKSFDRMDAYLAELQKGNPDAKKQ